jgi:hypothetical protein
VAVSFTTPARARPRPANRAGPSTPGSATTSTRRGTKLGAEYNTGSKNWLTFTPAADDVWTSKLGTRGNVYEAYIIQDVNRHAIAPKGKMFFRLGWQYYDFRWTNSNNWVGGTQPVNNLSLPEFFTPLDRAYDVYTTFEVHF